MAGRVTSPPPSPIYGYFQRIAKKIPLERGNYPYVTARVRAKKTLLLSADAYEKMLQMEIPQIARVLGEGTYKREILSLGTRLSGVDLIEVATSRNMAAVFTQIINFSESELRDMIAVYLDRFDVQNIKTIVRGRTFGASAIEIQEDIVAAGSMSERFLQDLIQLPTLEEIFKKLQGTIYAQALDELGTTALKVERWNEWEDLVTKLYYDNLLTVIPERTEGTRLMREWVQREIDLVNLRTLLRLWAAKARLKYDPFIKGGLELPKADLAEMIGLDASALASRLREYPLTEELSTRLRELEALGVGRLVLSVEKLLLLEAGRYAHVNPLSVLPVFDYIVRKVREVQNIRAITRGKESGLPSEVIRDLLVI